MAQVNDENVKPQIEFAINQMCVNATVNPQETLNNLLTIRNRIKEIVTNQ